MLVQEIENSLPCFLLSVLICICGHIGSLHQLLDVLSFVHEGMALVRILKVLSFPLWDFLRPECQSQHLSLEERTADCCLEYSPSLRSCSVLN